MFITQHRAIIGCTVFFMSLFVAQAFGHGDGGSSGVDLVKVAFTPSPSVPEFANAKGVVAVNLAAGVIEVRELSGFPFDTAGNRILPVTVTSTTDPRLKGHGGEPGSTSCEEEEGKWLCHVHSYVIWLAELEGGALGHPIVLGTIYPRTDGTTAERNFSFREGDLTGFGANVIIITAEVSFGPLPSVVSGPNEESSVEMSPRGPIVLQANLP